MKAIRILPVILLGILQILFAQSPKDKLFEQIEGHWEGAFIKNNSAQKLKVQFYRKGESPFVLQFMEEWYPQYGEFALPLSIDSSQNITFNTGYGKAIMSLDPDNRELIGQLAHTNPAIYLHLKQIPRPPAPMHKLEEIVVENGDVQLNGHLHSPKYQASKTAIIIVNGRSCYAGETEYDLYAKVLRQYGVSVLAFDKRGTGQSTGDCSTATVEDLASDVRACKKWLEKHPSNFEHIGVIGSSAGGWVMAKAQEKADFDFMIGIVGPASSVYDQQMQSMRYGAEIFNLSDQAVTSVSAYTQLMFNSGTTEEDFAKFKGLLKLAKEQGWDKLLDDTDIPPSAEEISMLWVRRHRYDPAQILSSYQHPFLAIYGGIDWVVPYQENIEELESFFQGPREKLLSTVIAHNAGHGTEVESAYIELADKKSYWHFYRISPQVLIEIVEFLGGNGFLE